MLRVAFVLRSTEVHPAFFDLSRHALRFDRHIFGGGCGGGGWRREEEGEVRGRRAREEETEGSWRERQGEQKRKEGGSRVSTFCKGLPRPKLKKRRL